MKVLQVNAVYETGSTGGIVADMVKGLSALGVDSRVAASVAAPSMDVLSVGSPLDRKFHAFASRVSGKQAYYSRRGTEHLLAYIASERPDVVHLHNLHANYINLPMLLDYLGSNDIATALTLHDCWFFTGKCCHYTAEGCDRWLTGCGSCPRVHKDNPSWFFDRSSEMWADKKRWFAAIPRLAAIGVSDWITGEATRSLLADAALIRRIYNWIDLDVFSPADAGCGVPQGNGEDDFVMLAVASRWRESKGLGDLIRLGEAIDQGVLAAMLAGMGGSSATRHRIQMVGQIPPGVRLPGSFEPLGEVGGARDLAAIYSRADVFLQLSEEESFGKVTAEALACGTPAIVYDSTANPELVGDGCGHVAQRGDVHDVMRCVLEVQMRGKSAYMRSCRDFATEHFGMEQRIGEHVALYSELTTMRRS